MLSVSSVQPVAGVKVTTSLGQTSMPHIIAYADLSPSSRLSICIRMAWPSLDNGTGHG